jgi:hypothetical protein
VWIADPAILANLINYYLKGKNADLTSKPKGFGEVNVRSNIEGTELLEKYGDDADFMGN